MKIALIHDARFPVVAYGGTERVVWWLAKGLHEKKIEVTLVARPGSTCPFARVVPWDFKVPVDESKLNVDLVHYFATPSDPPKLPYLVTIGGNGREGETYLSNTVFVSRNHAERHLGEKFVYNGIDPDEYLFSEKKEPFLLFLAKASWRVKNVRGAIRFARLSRHPLCVVGGSRPLLSLRRGVRWVGMLGGQKKAEWIARSSGLLFPVLWNEPFGLAVIEALMSGTPVIASRMGSLPELIPPSVGRLCSTEEEFLGAIADLSTFSPKACRAWAMENFHYHRMANDYLFFYEKILARELLHSTPPRALTPSLERS